MAALSEVGSAFSSGEQASHGGYADNEALMVRAENGVVAMCLRRQDAGVRLDYGRFAVGYHGCDAALARRVLLGESTLEASDNDYDWLGRGIYFWEHGPARALAFAVEEARRKATKIKEPAVLGAYIFLGDCLDLFDVRYTALLETVHARMVEDLRARGEPVPVNSQKRSDGTRRLHNLDCAVIEYAIQLSASARKFDTVRGAFCEGGPAFPGAEIAKQSHIQIAVRNSDCVLGNFRPKEIDRPTR